MSCQHRAAERTREHKHRMLPFDHLQRDAQIVQNRHQKILKPTGKKLNHGVDKESFRCGIGVLCGYRFLLFTQRTLCGPEPRIDSEQSPVSRYQRNVDPRI